jgi:hypothetical protein
MKEPQKLSGSFGSDDAEIEFKFRHNENQFSRIKTAKAEVKYKGHL